MRAATRPEPGVAKETLDALPFGVAVFDPARRLVIANREYREVLGLDASSVPPGTSFEAALRTAASRGIFGAGDTERDIAETLARNRSGPVLRHLSFSDGRSFDSHSTPLPDGGFIMSLVETSRLMRVQDEQVGDALRLRTAVSAARVGLGAFAADGSLFVYNARFALLQGLPLSALAPGMSFAAVIRELRRRPEYDDIEGHPYLDRQERLDRSHPHSTRRLRPNGQVIDVASDPLAEGGWTITVSDVTALAQAEAEARRRAAMLDSILENVPHGVCVWGPDRRVTLFNHAYTEVMNGAPLAIGDRLADVIRRRADAAEYGPGDPDSVFAEQMAHDIARPQARRRQRPNGTTVDVRTAPLPDGGHVSVVTDVTPLMEAESELLRRAGQMDVMLANIRHGITLFGPDGTLLAANRRASELLGLPPGFLVPGRTEAELVATLRAGGNFADAAATAARVRDGLGAGRDIPYAYLRSTRDGRILEVRGDPAPGNTVVVTYTDVTEAERAQAEQRRAHSAAEAANIAKSRFLATMSHELRTPLNSVIGFSEALLRQAEADPARVFEFAGAINEAGRHLLGLINTILDVARIEAGRFEMSADTIDVDRLVRSAARMAEPSFLAGEIMLRLDVAPGLPSMRADERRLQQVLGNLLSNAVKFTPANGEVVLRAALTPAGGLALTVADTGIGIAETDLERVFEPFVQLDGALTRRFQGAGLGLYMSRLLVEAHGGQLLLRSRTNVGTTAEIVLPGWRLIGEAAGRERA
jgi:signal transduction histidine kinase